MNPVEDDPSADQRADTGSVLDVLSFPLHGSRLIEASAGTGKTFTIAMLYLRLVLAHGGEAAYERALSPPEILVVTFTDAATEELRDRIRRRLTDAVAAFLADPADVPVRPEGEDLLHDLRASYPPARWAANARKLQAAVEWMDEAAVSTIHGWCNRMLREHAFDSGSLFHQTLEDNSAPLMAEVVRDYWRAHFATLDLDDATQVRQWWTAPDALGNDVGRVLRYAHELGAPELPCDLLAAARTERRQVLAQLKQHWPQWLDELADLFDCAIAAKAVNGNKIQAKRCADWLQRLRDWLGDENAAVPALTDAAWSRLSPEGIADAWKGDPPAHPAFAALAELRASAAALPDAREAILAHASCWVRERFAAEQARRAQLGFDELLQHLDAALHGPNGAALAQTIRTQFPVALIDEFQDTDPVQYRIFDAVYRVASNSHDTGLVLIGDPKQAIYGFRGADIYTYLRARAAVAGRLYVLKQNFRSTAAMVAATNHCFAVAERSPEGAGAFLFRGAHGNPVPFIEAGANGRADSFVVDGVAQTALTAWWLPERDDGKPVAKGVYEQAMADACAAEIARLLLLGQQDRAGFLRADAPLRALRPADVAVLVNSGHEARVLRRALARQGVRSVYLSERQSVFASPVAVEIERWLRACADPDDGRLLRAALATPSLALPFDALERLNVDELEWERRGQQFQGYEQCWREKGVLPMLRRLLDDFGVPARLRLAAGGERTLTDMLHIAELLQEASARIDGELALIRYLESMRVAAEQGEEHEALTVRLESDADLVRVVTVHKSKGLEYPLVFLPFAVSFQAVRPDRVPMIWHDEQGRLQVALKADAQAHARADQERLGEDLRKLYVALTRAQYAVWAGFAAIANLQAGAFGYLLGRGRTLDGEPLAALLEAWRGGHPHIGVASAPPPDDYGYRAQAPLQGGGQARRMRRAVREHWWIASYSALQAEPGEAPRTPAEDVFLEEGDDLSPARYADSPTGGEPVQLLLTDATLGALHEFPRGAAVGTFFHDILEWAAQQHFDCGAAQREAVHDAIARRCNVRGWESWIAPLTEWLCAFVSTPLPLPPAPGSARARAPAPAHITLNGLATFIAEMEFWVAAKSVDVREIDALLRRHALPGAARDRLLPATLNGMLKGFVDLVFEHEGRYYVMDYKSNYLGPDTASYAAPALRAAILEKRYELQYVLYLFALHRLLASRLPDYDYDRHIGGAVYVFLRGTGAGGGVFTDRPPRALIEALDRMFAGVAPRETA